MTLRISAEGQVWLDVGNQHFPVGPQFEERAEAEWYRDQLGLALSKLVEGALPQKDKKNGV